MTLTIELTEEQLRTLQRAQYRNTESLAHTLLRLAKLVPEPKPEEMSVYDQMSVQAQKDLEQQEDGRLRALLEEWEAEEP